MSTTLTSPSARLDKLLLFHFLFVTAWVILCAQLLGQSPGVDPLILSSLVITLTCLSTLVGLKIGHDLGNHPVRYSLLAGWRYGLLSCLAYKF